MPKRLLWKIGGEAGFGIMTTGLVLSKIAARSGYHIFDYIEYPSLIRGGHNTYEVLISDETVHASKIEVDLLVCLNRETYTLHKHRLTGASIVVYDSEEFAIEEAGFVKVNLPLSALLKQEAAPIVMMNNIALGASLALMGFGLDLLHAVIEQTFQSKGQEVVDKNKRISQLGFDHIAKNYQQVIKPLFPAQNSVETVVLSGNDAFSMGAVLADCRLYCAYPMTPSSSVLTTLADWAEKVGMVVRHAEDEIAVINTALGSSFAGVRSAVGTSGGGFALMVESLSFAGVAEIPLVIFLAQRPGPATGMPTWTEQGELLFAIRAGHGEFPKIILAPGDVSEMFELTLKAFDLADIYQTPVLVMSDKLLSESHWSASSAPFKLLEKSYTINRGKIFSEFEKGTLKNKNEKYLRYKITADGISPMLIPGLKGFFYQANSYEHLEDGHTTEESAPRIAQVDKRNRKRGTYLKTHFVLPKLYGDSAASTVFVSWGSCKGPILEAMEMLKDQGVATALLHFTHVHPLDEDKVAALFSPDKRYILVENNSLAQFGRLLRKQAGVHIEDKLLKYDGRPFWPEEIANYVTRAT